jgi:hypothetical protein
MDAVQVGILGLVNGAIGNTLNALNLGRDLNSKKPRLTIELQGVRFVRSTRIPLWEKISEDLVFYEAAEIYLINESSKELLIRELNMSFFHTLPGEESFTHPRSLEQNIVLKPYERKVVIVEPWHWFAALCTQLRLDFDDRAWKNFLLSIDELQIGFDVASDPHISLRNKTERLWFDPERASFLNGDESGIGLESLVMRDYRTLKQGILDDYELGRVDPGSTDEEAYQFARSVTNALKLAPEMEGTVLDDEIQFNDPFSLEFKEPNGSRLDLMAYGGDAARFKIVKAHLQKNVNSKVWDLWAADYLVMRLIEHLESPSVRGLESVHPDFLIDPVELLSRFGIYEENGVRSNAPLSEILSALQGPAQKSPKRRTDSFGIPLE